MSDGQDNMRQREDLAYVTHHLLQLLIQNLSSFRHLKKIELYRLIASKPLPASVCVNSKTNKNTLINLLLNHNLNQLHGDEEAEATRGGTRDSSAARLSAELERLDEGHESRGDHDLPFVHGGSIDVVSSSAARLSAEKLDEGHESCNDRDRPLDPGDSIDVVSCQL